MNLVSERLLFSEVSSRLLANKVGFSLVVLVSQFEILLLQLVHEVSDMMLVEVHGEGTAELRGLFHVQLRIVSYSLQQVQLLRVIEVFLVQQVVQMLLLFIRSWWDDYLLWLLRWRLLLRVNLSLLVFIILFRYGSLCHERDVIHTLLLWLLL